MEKSAQIGEGLSGKHVYIPHVDETPVPCPDGYMCTDCVYGSDGIDGGYFGLDKKSNITDIFNAMICHIKEQDNEISYLKQQLNILR